MTTEIEDALATMTGALSALTGAIYEGTDDDRKAALSRALDAYAILSSAVESPF